MKSKTDVIESITIPGSAPAGLLWSGDPTDDEGRVLAWANAICLLFLSVGVIGLFDQAVKVPPLRPSAEHELQVVLVPSTPPPEPQVLEPSKASDTDLNSEETTIMVPVVAPITAGFAVPVVGVVGSPLSLAPLIPFVRARAAVAEQPLPTLSTGAGGERPQPPYPKLALEMRMEGVVELALHVDAAGSVSSIEVTKSSGYPLLDRVTEDFIKKHWIVPPQNGVALYETRIRYQLSRS